MTRIVIIGGGIAGLTTAQVLAKNLTEADSTEIVILEKNSFYYHIIGAPRAYVDADYINKMFIPYDNAFPKHAKKFVRIVRGVATRISVDPNEVSYYSIGSDDKESETVEKLTFDYLVLATGISYCSPIIPGTHDYARSATEKKLEEVREHIERAEKILVIGGGSVGCEVAGEIKAKYPSKSVTIVHSRSKLMSGDNLCEKFQKCVDDSYEKLGVKVILGERLMGRLSDNGFEKRVFRTDKGTEIESDIQLLCGGFNPATAMVQEMDASLVDERGFVKVKDNFQLEGEKYAHLFALGDMANHPTPKMAYLVVDQAKFLAGELTAVLRKKQTNFTKSFESSEMVVMILPLGPSGGISQLPIWGGFVLGDWFTWLFKSRDYFAKRLWASVGATAPN